MSPQGKGVRENCLYKYSWTRMIHTRYISRWMMTWMDDVMDGWMMSWLDDVMVGWLWWNLVHIVSFSSSSAPFSSSPPPFSPAGGSEGEQSGQQPGSRQDVEGSWWEGGGAANQWGGMDDVGQRLGRGHDLRSDPDGQSSGRFDWFINWLHMSLTKDCFRPLLRSSLG